jgi:signal transduction histidine kinase
VDFLHKPIDPHVLRSKVEVFAELYEQRRHAADQVEKLRAALRMNEMFVAVLSHDLRNPLSAVMNGASLLPMLSRDEKVVSTAARIRSSATRMSRMVEQLLDIARVRGGRIQMRPTPGDLAAMTTLLAQEFERGGEAPRVEICAQGDTHAEFDPDRIGAAISNLLGNAVQHGAAGSVVRVAIDGSRPAEVVIAISNEGTIPPEILGTIFEPFHSSGEGQRAGGLGLGLYIVREFVGANGGTTEALSGDGRTTFRIVLPRVADPAPGAGALLSGGDRA